MAVAMPYVDPLLRRQKIEDMAPDEFITIPITDLNQSGPLVAGPGAKRDVAASILGVSLPKIDRKDQDYVAKGKKYAMEQSIKYVLMKQNLAHQQQQAKSMQRHQALVLMSRVYIGSISFEIREDTIRQGFAPFGPIKTINMSWDPVAKKHKGFAFVEYDLPEAAQIALEQMDGVMIGGRSIKCGRDTRIKFSNMDQVIEDIMDEARVYHRIYVSSIHQDLSEEDIKSVFEAFGRIVSCKLAPGPAPNKHRGYGFIEYETPEAANEAITSMNLFDLGGQYLRVGKSITPPNALQANPGQNQMPTAAALAAAAVTAKIQAIEAVSSTHAAFGLHEEPPPPPVPVVVPQIPVAPAATVPLAPPQLVVPKFGLSIGSAPSSNLPPPGLAILPTPGSLGVGSMPHIPAPVIVPPTLAAPLASQTPPKSSSGFSAFKTEFPPPPPPPPVAGPSDSKDVLVKQLEEEKEYSLSAQENMSIKGTSARHLVMQKLMRDEKSPVIVLKNMVGPEDVDDTLQEEIMEECSKFGAVEKVLIYQEAQSESEDAPIIVKIFVEFSNPDEADRARLSLHQRFFAGRIVQCLTYDRIRYINQDLSG